MNSFNSIEAVLSTYFRQELPPEKGKEKKRSNNGKGWDIVWKKTVDKLKKEDSYGKSEKEKKNND